MKRTIVLAVALTVLAGCGAAPLKRYFQIAALPGKAAQTEPFFSVLRIDAVDVDPIYNDLRMIYRTSPVELHYYAYDFWLAKPAKLIEDALVAFYRERGLARQVVHGITTELADYSIKARVLLLEESDDGANEWARLQMDLLLIDCQSGKTLLAHHVDRRERGAQKTVAGFVHTLSRILTEELALFTAKFPVLHK